jgi:hypothetical protein
VSLPPDVERYVERKFAEGERVQALELLRKAVLEDGKPASPRLLRCALLTSEGKLDRLRSQVEHIAVDYRDVILEAEYEKQRGEFVRMRDLNEPLMDDA